MSKSRSSVGLVGGILIGVATWLLAATQLPNAAEQRNAMIRELKQVNAQLAATAKQQEAANKQLVAMQKELEAIRKNTQR